MPFGTMVKIDQARTEQEWVRKIRLGDGASFEQLFRSYCQPLVRFVRRYVGGTSIAEDLVQDVFVAVWSNRSRLDPEMNIRTYLYAAARNRALKHLRHGEVKRRSAGDVERALPPQKTPAEELQGNELAAGVAEAIEALPGRTRIVFSMNRFDRLTYAEIAEIQGVSIKTVETQMGRALKFLRDRLSHFL